ncbi:MAG: patatin-like phospholipase family protein [archaeon]
MKTPKIGLALGGGAAKGIAYIGVLKVLERNKIPIDYISGTSIGSVIGGLYASGYSAKDLEKIAIEMDWKSLFDFSQLERGLISGKGMEKKIRELLNNKQFNDLKIKFIATAVDIKTGREYFFNKGDVAKAIRASIAIPGLFAPVHLNNMILVDGGVIDPVPVKSLKGKCDKVIAVASTMQLYSPKFKGMPHPDKHKFVDYIFDESIKSLKEQLKLSHKISRAGLFFFNREKLKAMMQGPSPEIFIVASHSYNIMMSNLTKISLEQSPPDVLIEANIEGINMLDFDKIKNLIKRGEKAALREMPKIKKIAKIK